MKMAMPSNDYWKKREDEERKWQKKNIASDEAFNRLIERYYNQAISQINKEIDHQYQSLAKSVGGLRSAYSTVDITDIADHEAEAQKLVMQAAQMRAQGKKVTYSSFGDDVNRRMKVYNATMRINRLEYLKSQVGLHLTEANMNIENVTRLKLTDSYINEVKRQSGILGRNLKFNNALIEDTNIAKIVMAQTAGANWSQRLWLNQDALKAQLDVVLSNRFITGQSNQAMARQLRNQIKSTINNHAYVAERLVRTETARVQYQAQIDSIKAADYKYVKWYAEPGACHVCQRIADNDEYDLGYGVFPVDEVPQIPIHPNCRCSISAYWVDGKDNLGKSKKNKENSSASDETLISKYTNDDFKKHFTQKDLVEISKRMDKAPKYIKQMWEKYLPQMRMESITEAGENCFSPKTRKVSISKSNLYGTGPLGKGHNPYDVVFHEFGHSIDNMAYSNMIHPYSVSAEPKYSLAWTLNKELDSYVDRYIEKAKHGINPADVRTIGAKDYYHGVVPIERTKAGKITANSAKKIGQEMFKSDFRSRLRESSNIKYGDVSDMIQAASNDKIMFNYGHRKGYFNYPGSQEREFFAEMTSAYVNNPASLEVIKEFFPKSVKIYQQIVEDIAKGDLPND
ncbi:minor capsid protein [uncultured Limosilactobacillus sp.]|uniref:minor capsid protein n=2 Tax=uncultured Limosilactobacillus sp. TaxID=2837629 RepID=UPI00272D62E0|nr:minor capsid protein [uncultured Limosilactobacillus sp.]